MKTKKELVESFGYATLASELYMDHWNAKLAQVEGLDFALPAPKKELPMAESYTSTLNIRSINESVALLMGKKSLMEDFATADADESEDEEVTEDEEEVTPPEAWMESREGFMARVKKK